MSWSWRDEGCCACSEHDEEVAREAGVPACPLFNPSEDMEDCRECDYWHCYDY